MGFRSVITQTTLEYVANQNAKRLHGVSPPGVRTGCTVPVSVVGNPILQQYYLVLSHRSMALVLRQPDAHWRVGLPRPTNALRNAMLYNVANSLWENRSNLWGRVSDLVTHFRSRGSTGKVSKSKSGKGRPPSLDRMTHTSKANVVSMDTTLRTPTYWNQTNIPLNEGLPGNSIRITGRQYVAIGQTGVADKNFFGGVAYYQLSPDTIGGRLALIARTYGKYAFRHVRMIFITSAPTDTFGSFALAYANDPEFGNFGTVNFQTAFQFDPSVISTIRTDCSLEVNYSGEETFWTENDTTSSASGRQCVQGNFYAIADQILYAQLYGYWMIEYVCDLYQPVADLGFTLFRRMRDATQLDAANDALDRIQGVGDDSVSQPSVDTVLVPSMRTPSVTLSHGRPWSSKLA